MSMSTTSGSIMTYSSPSDAKWPLSSRYRHRTHPLLEKETEKREREREERRGRDLRDGRREKEEMGGAIDKEIEKTIQADKQKDS